MTRRLQGSQPVIEENGTMVQEFRTATIRWENSVPLTGTGSPEGVVEAPQFSSYIDKTGTSGSIWYVKRDANIAGDKTKGWIAV